MPRITQIIIVLAAASAVWGQNTYPWPQTGNVGIGTNSPVGWSTLDLGGLGTLSISGSAGAPAAAIITSEHGNGGNGQPLLLKARPGNGPDLYITTTGAIGMGTTSPSYTLDVKGSIGATDIYVASNALPDYVFDAGYRNAPLSEVAAYIEQNHHLPGMPSAADAEKNRLSVADMQNKLLQKVEELTLHMIAAEKRNTELEQEVRKLQAQLQSGARASETQDQGGGEKK